MLNAEHIRAVKVACERLQNCSKKVEKREIIRELSETNVFFAIRALLNPLMTTGLKEKSITKPVHVILNGTEPLLGLKSLDDLITYLSRQDGITDKTIGAVQFLISELPEDLQDFTRAYLCKTVRLGVTAKSVNEAIDRNVIPVMECMLANKYFEHQSVVENKSFAITEKLDGIRAIAYVTPAGHVKIFSRQGQLIEGLVDIEKELLQLGKESPDGGEGFVLDGELLVDKRELYESKEQYKNTIKIVRKDGEKHGVVYHVFDFIPYSEFVLNSSRTPYQKRRSYLDLLLPMGRCHWVRVVPVKYMGSNVAAISHCLEYERLAKHEGIMINLLDAPYRFGRTSDLLKVKVMQDCDLRIIGVEEGSGKFAGMLGALVVDYKGNELRVGSGFTDHERRKIWETPDLFIGNVVSVQYFEETQDKDGKLSLRFPVFLRFREEGKEVSYN